MIGNPPYIQLQANGGELAKIYQDKGFETFEKTGDLYCLFTERAFGLLGKNGSVSYIMPNKWMLSAYGRKLRHYLKQKRINYLMNFGDVQFFESATNYVCVFDIENAQPESKIKVLSLNQNSYNGSFTDAVSKSIESIPFDEFSDDEWIIRPRCHVAILEKMFRIGILLKSLPINIDFGIKTGLDKAYVIDSETRNQLISKDAGSKKIIKKILRGRDIDAYVSQWNDKWLVNLHNGIKESGVARLKAEDYPELKKYLDSFGRQLKSRADQGDTPYNLRNCAYLKHFDQPKIIYPNMTTRFPFAYDEDGLLVNPKCYILTTKHSKEFLKFLTGVFNSRLTKLWVWYYCPELNGGARELQKMCFERFPVPNATDRERALIVGNVDRILAAKKINPTADTSVLEAEIDQLVYKLYGLTEEEIAVVEGRGKQVADKTGKGENGSEVAKPRRRGIRPVATAAVKTADDEELE